MKVLDSLGQAVTQQDFAVMIGVSEARVSQLVSEGVIAQGQSALEWNQAYTYRIREQAAGRMGSEAGGLDLVQERALHTKEMRIHQRLKNDIARGEYAPIGLLADVLGMASSAVVDRFEQLEGALRKSCPSLSDDAKATVIQVIASARNEWIRSTAKLVNDALETMAAEEHEAQALIDASEDF